MPCVVAIHGNEAVFIQDLPRRLKALKLAELSPGIDTKDFVIKARVVKRWARQKTLLKFQLAEDNYNERLNVFLKGTFAEECDVAEEGDILAMSNVTIESNTRQLDPADHSCQAIVDTDQAHVWLLRSRKLKNDLADNAQPSTSVATETPPVVRLNPQPSNSSAVTSGQSAPATSSSSSTNKPSVARTYMYTPLKDVQSGMIVNVFGVVKFFKQPTKTRGSDYCMVLSLVDPSFTSSHLATGAKLKCLLFARDATQLPALRNVLDIVRMHRLKISTYRDELQGQCGAGFSCLVFEGSVDAPLEPITPSTTYTLTDTDLHKVKELRNWSHSDHLSLTQTQENSITTLSDVVVGRYFDLTCQVVATCVVQPNVSLLLRVWDGTNVNGPTYEEDTRDEELTNRLACDKALIQRAIGYIVDVFVFDDHFVKASHIKPSDYVTFHNLHAMRHRNPKETNTAGLDIIPSIEFCLHHGSSFGRGLTVLPPNSHHANTLKTRLDAVVIIADSSYTSEDEVLARDWQVSMDVDGMEGLGSRSVVCGRKNVRKRNVETEQGTGREAVSHHGLGQGEDARCMLRTATVVTGHHHVTHTTLCDVARHSAPYMFRVRCHLVAFHPEVSTAEEFLHLFCPTCHFLSAVPRGHSMQCKKERRMAAMEISHAAWLTNAVTSGVRSGVKYYTCPQCQEAQQQDHGPETSTEGVASLQYIYMLRFVMQDETGWLPVCLWREEAMKFFHHVEPVGLLKDTHKFLRINTHLENMCGKNRDNTSANTPIIECCIQSYKTSRGTTYEMFDTTICLSD